MKTPIFFLLFTFISTKSLHFRHFPVERERSGNIPENEETNHHRITFGEDDSKELFANKRDVQLMTLIEIAGDDHSHERSFLGSRAKVIPKFVADKKQKNNIYITSLKQNRKHVIDGNRNRTKVMKSSVFESKSKKQNQRRKLIKQSRKDRNNEPNSVSKKLRKRLLKTENNISTPDHRKKYKHLNAHHTASNAADEVPSSFQLSKLDTTIKHYEEINLTKNDNEMQSDEKLIKRKRVKSSNLDELNWKNNVLNTEFERTNKYDEMYIPKQNVFPKSDKTYNENQKHIPTLRSQRRKTASRVRTRKQRRQNMPHLEKLSTLIPPFREKLESSQ